ncbi:MAG: hypothetical protein LBP75_00375 [Planctomycetota bacterium]|jgi:hypothetical protein|nr:hypothetical protein [Planctomycetota bacterium]
MATVLTHDPYLADSTPLDECLRRADGIILGAPHREYRELAPRAPFVDCWGYWR